MFDDEPSIPYRHLEITLEEAKLIPFPVDFFGKEMDSPFGPLPQTTVQPPR